MSKSLRLEKIAGFASEKWSDPTDLPVENIYSMAGTAAGVILGDDWTT